MTTPTKTKEKKEEAQQQLSTTDVMEEANKALELELHQQATSIVAEAQQLLSGNTGVEAKVVFYWVAKKYFTNRQTGQPYNPKDWLLDVLAYGSLIKRLGLNPMTGDLAVTHYFNKQTNRYDTVYITTIQAMRKIAHRTGHFGGSGNPEITEDENGNLIKADATVYIINDKTGERMPVEGRAYWAEFAKQGKGDNFWKKMPRHMLGKCALAQAFRNAFSEEFASIYIAEEVMRDEEVIDVAPVVDKKSGSKKAALASKLESNTSSKDESNDAEQKPETENEPQTPSVKCFSCGELLGELGQSEAQTIKQADGTLHYTCKNCVTIESDEAESRAEVDAANEEQSG